MLLTKLHIPQPKENVVHRIALFEKLDIGLTRKLILVSATAGYGKTTLVCDWINQSKIPTAWYSMDSHDNDPYEFLTFIISGIQAIHQNIGNKSMDILKSRGTANIEYICELLINDILTLETDFLLVIDDLHLIDSKEVYKILSFIIDYKPRQFKIAILTRSDPPLSLARLRSQNELLEIRSSDLSFTERDTTEFFNKKLKLGLTLNDINLLELKTEGWIAGLQLTAITLQNKENVSEFIRKIAGGNRYIMDYLIEEVLNTLDNETRDFLLKTSVLVKLSGPLCDAVLQIDNSQFKLESLEKNNMFIVALDNERHWFRYHHLFGDLLKQRLLINEKQLIPVLHNKASIWFEKNNIPLFAIDHSLLANNFERAAYLIDQQADSIWLRGEHTLLQRFLEGLPTNILLTKPKLSIYFAWLLFTNGKFDEAELTLKSVEELLSPSSGEKNKKTPINNEVQLQGRVAAIRASIASFRGEINNIIHFSEQALKHLSKEDDTWRCIGAMTLGDAHMLNNNTRDAAKAYFEAVVASQTVNDINLYLMSNMLFAFAEAQLGRLQVAQEIYEKLLNFVNEKCLLKTDFAGWLFAAKSYLFYEWNDLESAVEYANKGVEKSVYGHNVFIKGIVYNNLIAVLFANHDLVAAEKGIKEIEKIVAESDVPRGIINWKEAWRARLWLAQGNIQAVSEWVRRRCWNEETNFSYLHKDEIIVFARILIAHGKYNVADKLLKRLISQAESASQIVSQIELLLIHALVLTILENKNEAKISVLKALSIAEPGGFIRIFIGEGETIEILIKTIKNEKATKVSDLLNLISSEYLSKLLEAFKNEKKTNKNTTENVLSARELDTLKLLAEDYSNQQIADELFISLNTVKTHLKNINLKLEVDSRTKAVEKAKALGLI
jgi:LuxR family transcriptional regulator, maltose regulon positive regulatory protein